MATIQDLFKNKEKEIYGTTDMVRIESKGLVNISRAAALLASSPNSVADLIGNQIGGALKGNANRPDDTIFKGKAVFNKPISLGKTQYDLQHAVDADSAYYVKQSPAPASLIAKLQQGASSPAQLATNVAVSTIQKFGLNKNTLKNMGEALKGISDGAQSQYGPSYSQAATGVNDPTKSVKFSDYKQNYKQNGGRNGLKPRTQEDYSWDAGADDIIGTTSFDNDDKLKEAIKKYRVANQVWVTFQKYGNNEIIPFIGAITGITEDIQTEWNGFKYIGSPFKTYRYGGVERSLKFDLKIYYRGGLEKEIMIKKVNYLKSLTFPYETISEITYGDNKQSSQYAFSPNLVYLSIGDLYKNMFGYMESLSFSIDDNTTWPNNDVDADGSTFDGSPNPDMLYPSVIHVSINMKIIENQKVEKGTITKYKYNFDGLNGDGKYTIAETEKTEKTSTDSNNNTQNSNAGHGVGQMGDKL